MTLRTQRLVAAALLVLAACRGAAEQTAPPASVAATTPAATTPAANASRELGYPSRALPDRGLDSLLLSASHIVIAHRDAKPVAGLTPVAPNARDRAAALARAFALRDQLELDPGRFAALAASESDEPTTASMAGALGVFGPYDVPEVLRNALAHLRVGEISRVVESEQGFHLLRREAVPPNDRAAISHIVIKHGAATGWQRSDRPLPARTRDQARTLAAQVAQQARGATAEAFAELARRESDADDALRGGEMGVFARHEPPGSDYMLFNAAFRLAVDAVSAPIETPTGFHIVRRGAVRERPVLAASVIAIAYSGSQLDRLQPSPLRSKAQAERVAQQLLAELRRAPDAFAQRRLEYCELIYCGGPLSWPVGRGLPALEAALAPLAIGAIAAQAIEAPSGLLVVKREDPKDVPLPAPEPVSFEFPSGLDADPRLPLAPAAQPQPQAPRQAASPQEAAVVELVSLEKHLRSALELPPKQRGELTRILGQLRSRIAASHGEFDAEYDWAEGELRRALDEDAYEAFVRQRRVWSAQQVP